MTDSYSYSYSYTGSYTGDDDYSYSYSYSGSATEEKARREGKKGSDATPKGRAKRESSDYNSSYGYDDDDYSYSYSYSNSSSPLLTPPPQKGEANGGAAAPPASSGAKSASGMNNINKSNAKIASARGGNSSSTDDYDDSYTYSYSDDYSYSYTDSQSEMTGPSKPMRRKNPTPTPAEVEARKRGSVSGADAVPSPNNGANGSNKALASRNDDTASYSYSYSYSEDASQRAMRPPAGQGGATDSYYYYSDDYGSSSYYYTGGGTYSTDSYSYTGDSSYYYSSSSGDARNGARNENKAAGKADDASYYYDSYADGNSYSDSYDNSNSYYSGRSYYYSEDSYYHYDSYEDSEYYYYSSSSAPAIVSSSSSYYYDDDYYTESDEDKNSSSSYSYTDSATSKSDSSTTSSYGYTSSNPSVMSVTENEKVRDMVVLRAPAQDTPRAPPAPRRCFVSPKSIEDGVWAFLQRLLRLQQTYEARKGAAAAAATAAAAPSFVKRSASTQTVSAAPVVAPSTTPTNSEEDKAEREKKSTRMFKIGKSKSKMKTTTGAAEATTSMGEPNVEEESQDSFYVGAGSTFIPTKDNCFSQRSLRIAFQVLRLNHLERTEALKNAPAPLPMETMFDIYNTCVAARAKERVVQAFLAHDAYRSGEVPMSVMGELLRRLGLGTSPVLHGTRISLAVSGDTVPEMVMNVEQLVQTPTVTLASTGEEAEKEEREGNAAPSSSPQLVSSSQVSLQWEVTPVYVSRIVRKNAAAKMSTPVEWAHNTIYMGRHAIVRNVTSEALFERLKTYIEAATYLCVLTNIFAIRDVDRGTVTVQYPQFVRSVLLAQKPTSKHGRPAAAKLLVIENLFRTVFHPIEVLRSFEAGRGFPRYLHDWAVESTLHATMDTEEKRRRNVVPSITADYVRFIPAPPTRSPAEVQLSFVLQKVRVPGRLPANARCFCLVSAITAANVFLPAIEVPVCAVVKSSKDLHGYTWVFYNKKFAKKNTVLHFAGPAVDRIYVECCYETRDPPLVADQAGEVVGAARRTSSSDSNNGVDVLADSAVTTVWCAGYAVFAAEGAKTAVLPVSMGSLLQSTQVSPTAEGTSPQKAVVAATTTDKTAKSTNCCLSLFSRLGKHEEKMAPVTASNIKVEVIPNKKPIAGVEKLPARFIAYQRHVPMIAQLRSAVELVGTETAYALQAFRQQAVRYIFAVAADAALLDQLCTLWAHRTKHWSKTERKDSKEQHVQLLGCVAALYALNNCCASSKHQFAQALMKEKSLQMTVDPSAPLLPVRV